MLRGECHVDITEHVIDQLNQQDSSGQNLVENNGCQCIYNFNQDWPNWVASVCRTAQEVPC